MPIRGMRDKRELDKDKLKEIAFIDDLTSLYNRRYLYRYLPAELRDIQAAGKQLSLFMMDVDNFKGINDTYGHLCGDKILVEVAEILRRSFREGDTVIRYAGDEFMAILPGAEENVAIDVAKRIVEKIDKAPFKETEGKTTIHVTLSIGLALFPRDAQDPEKLIYQADRALYSSKRSGRNCICATKDILAEVLDETRVQEIFPCAQLIGRDRQLSRLKRLLAGAERGQTQFALIKGERGSGKTRLINELKNYAQAKGITNISASCSPEISSQPYRVLIMALDNLFTSLGSEMREFIRSLPEAQTLQLANYIPALKQVLPEEMKAVRAQSGEQAQIDLFKGISQSIIYIVRRNAFLLIVDDFHWIDKQTLQLFDYIIKNMRSIPIFIVGAYRAEEVKKRTDEPSLKELLGQIEQSELVAELMLEPLVKEDVLKMTTAVFSGMQIRPEFVDIVYDVSAGNPLFIEEALRALVNKGFIFYQDGSWHARQVSEGTLPPFLKEAIQRRVSLLDEETRPVLSAAAVIGQVFDFDVLCQLLEKDPGYILEVMDRLTKQHLILTEGAFQTDKFKFNSGAIRDIIYNSLDPQEKQDLHRKLALIEERINKDKIDTVAGSLGYHFSKAQDAEKSQLYANMLLEKGAQMPTYEDVFGFLQEALLEKVEEIVVPVSDVSMKLIPLMIRSLRLAIQNVRLYPAQSALRTGFIEQAYKYLSDILAKDSTLIVGTAENRLLINAEEISEKTAREAVAGEFIALMIEHRIKSITFKKEFKKEELITFFEYLSQSYDDIIAQGGLSGMLRKNHVAHIKVNEIRYEQTTKLTKQRIKFEETMLIDYLIGKVANLEKDETELAGQIANDPKRLAAALEKVAEAAKAEQGKDNPQAQASIVAQSLQKLSEQVLSQTKGGIEQYRKNIAQAMMSLDYKLRSKVIQAQVKTSKTATDKAAPGDVIKDAIREFSDEEIMEVLTKEFPDSTGNLNNMRNFVRRFFSDAQRRQRLLPKIKTKLLQLGFDEEEAAWVLEERLWQGLSLKEKAQRLTKLSPDNYIKLEVSKEIENLTSELLANDQYNKAGEIIDKLLKQLEGGSKALRLITVNDLDKISALLIVKEKYFLLEQVISSLIARLDQEKNPEVYSSVAEGLASTCAKLVKKQNFIQATGILRELNFRLKTDKLLDIQKEAISKARDRTIVSSPLLSWLVNLLKKKIEEHNDFYELSKFFSELGTEAVGTLFALGISPDQYTDPFKTYALRWSIAKVLKDIGDEAVVYLKDRLTDKNAQHNKATLEVLGHMQNRTAVKYLHPLLRHKDLNVRKEVIVTLGKIGGGEAIRLLSEPLKDKNRQIRLVAIWALANIGTKDVLPLLKPLLKEKESSEELKRIIRRIERMQK